MRLQSLRMVFFPILLATVPGAVAGSDGLGIQVRPEGWVGVAGLASFFERAVEGRNRWEGQF